MSTYIIVGLIAVLILLAGRKIWKDRKNGSCGCSGCSGCAKANNCSRFSVTEEDNKK